MTAGGQKLGAGQWRTAIESATRELAANALGIAEFQIFDPITVDRTVAMVGAHIPLFGGSQSFDLALVATPAGCQAMSRAILGAPATELLSDEVVADAVGELVNMLGGGIKRRLVGSGTELELGLPIFLHGHLQATSRLSVLAFPIRLGAIDAIVMIAGQRS